MRKMWLLAAVLVTGGCSGEFILTAPDVATPVGRPAPLVVRLQRREFWFYAPALADSVITFRSADGAVRAARTDQAGYAALTVELPPQPGRHEFSIYHQDVQGDTVSGRVRIYVLRAEVPIAAVDLDSLPAGGDQAGEAAAALRRVARRVQIIYLTQKFADDPQGAHEALQRAGYPDAAVQPYAKSTPWYSRRPWKRPRAPASVALLRERFERLRWGIAADASSAEAFARAGLEVLVVGDAPAAGEHARVFGTWRELRLPVSEASD